MLNKYLSKVLKESLKEKSCYTIYINKMKYRVKSGKISYILGNNIFVNNELLLNDLSERLLCQKK